MLWENVKDFNVKADGTYSYNFVLIWQCEGLLKNYFTLNLYFKKNCGLSPRAKYTDRATYSIFTSIKYKHNNLTLAMQGFHHNGPRSIPDKVKWHFTTCLSLYGHHHLTITN
jgi:hypothetical protein